jgi:hypothetical protein
MGDALNIKIQELINSINHNVILDAAHSYSMATKEGLSPAIVRYEIDRIAEENNLIYCNESEMKPFFENLHGDIFHQLQYRYVFSFRNKRTIFKKLVKQSFIKEIDFFIQDRKQIFIDLDRLVSLMRANDIDVRDFKYIKYREKSYFAEFEYTSRRHTSHSTVQRFKKWLKNYIPCSIKDIVVKKEKDKYIVSSYCGISIPFKPTSIKRLDVELVNIDTKYHKWDRIYDIARYKEKKLTRIEYELERLNTIMKEKF